MVEVKLFDEDGAVLAAPKDVHAMTAEDADHMVEQDSQKRKAETTAPASKPRPAKGKREEIQPIIGATYKPRSNLDLPYTVLDVVDHDDWRGKQVRARTSDGQERTFSANGIITGNDKLRKTPRFQARVRRTYRPARKLEVRTSLI
jgi:hypothetical protein